MFGHAIAGALVLTVHLAVPAQEWVPYATTHEGDQGSLDRASLRIEGTFRTIWTLLERSSAADHHGRPLQTWIALVEVDCRTGMHRSLRQLGYSPQGSLLYDTDRPAAPRAVVPHTVGEIRLQAICALPRP